MAENNNQQNERSSWYHSLVNRIKPYSVTLFYTLILIATGVAVVLSLEAFEIRIPRVIYLFGFLGAMVYVFTSFSYWFAERDMYIPKLLSRTIAVFPLVAGVYMIAFAFPGVSGDLSALEVTTAEETEVTSADRLVAGLVFLVGIFVSTTLRALGGIAERLLGVSRSGSPTTQYTTQEQDDKKRTDGPDG